MRRNLFIAALIVLLTTFFLAGQGKPPLTCEGIIGELYVQKAQLQRQLDDANQRAATAEAELSKLKEGK